ncbi:MAG: YqgE/AlgH family protein [Flavobacteriaceae bacterium]|jgi:putative transcriptional regulator|nr:YqgE/AlgH family protein [Flavobacteriaceae bacterium]
MSTDKNTAKLSAGNFIISLPSATNNDFLFSRAIALLVEHNNSETLGFILNKPTHLLLNEIVKETSSAFSIYYGGPVEQDSLFCIHQRPDLIPESKYISGDLYWGGDFEIIFDLINSGQLTKNDIRFFLGYSGWGPQQLFSEFDSSFWKKVPTISNKDLFTLSSDESWKDAVIKLGERYQCFVNAPLDPTFN